MYIRVYFGSVCVNVVCVDGVVVLFVADAYETYNKRVNNVVTVEFRPQDNPHRYVGLLGCLLRMRRGRKDDICPAGDVERRCSFLLHA